MPAHRLPALLGALATAALLAACTAGGGQAGPTPTTGTSSTGAAPTSDAPPSGSSSPSGPPSATDVRAATRLRADDATAWIAPADGVTIARKKDADGSLHLTFHDSRTEDLDQPIAYVTGSGPKALADGSALVGGGGMTPTGAAFATVPDDVLALSARADAGALSVWFAGTAVVDTSWGSREGGRSLAVTPSAWARAGGLAAAELTWSQVVGAEPEADSPSMHDQLSCHELGAPEKATWNLEPWRPDVDGLAMIASRCNPT